jgi:two-component system response regulator RegA
MKEVGSGEHTILLVDDNKAFRSVMARAFRSRGYRVLMAGDYTDALVVVRLSAPLYAVLDVGLPGPSGLELLRSIKALRPSTIVVMLTGEHSVETEAAAMRLGAARYLTKPTDADVVIAALVEADGG